MTFGLATTTNPIRSIKQHVYDLFFTHLKTAEMSWQVSIKGRNAPRLSYFFQYLQKYLLAFSGWFSRPICIQLSLIVQKRSLRSGTAAIHSSRYLRQMWRIQVCQRERLAMLPRSWSQIQVLFGIWERSVRSNFLTQRLYINTIN